MNIEQIKELIFIVEKSAITSFEMEESGYRIRIGKEEPRHKERQHLLQEPVKTGCSSPAFTGETTDPSDSGYPASQQGSEENYPKDFSSAKPAYDFSRIEIKSPMLGVFYASPSPDQAPFVKIGDRIKKGDVLCIIEAMKLMNEILAEKDGEIIDICMENGQIAEFAQTLFILKP